MNSSFNGSNYICATLLLHKTNSHQIKYTRATFTTKKELKANLHNVKLTIHGSCPIIHTHHVSSSSMSAALQDTSHYSNSALQEILASEF